ncbi:MAG: BamA/TamA family outer membrane protein [Bacteroidota bacterium]
MWKIACFLLLFISFTSSAQTNKLLIEAVTVEGNKKTKTQIILRELDFRVGDTLRLSEIGPALERNRRLILNTGLFTIVQMNVIRWDEATKRISIHIKVQETWYIFPIPIFELADRNFNVWWSEMNRDLERVNFGVRAYHLNITGRQDLLKLAAQYGYTQKYELEYSLPSINRSQTLGIWTNLFYSRNREIFVNTIDNKLIFERSDRDFLLRRRRLGGGLRYRPGLYFYHQISLRYFHNSVKETFAPELNPDYFLNDRSEQHFFTLKYDFSIDKRDIRPYPLQGYYLLAELQKIGLGFFDDRDALIFTGTLAQYLPVSKKFNLELIAKGQLLLSRNQQPYYNSRALGFEPDFLRGYELYVIDGQDFGFLKSSLRYELLNKILNFEEAMPIKQLKLMPLRIYLSWNVDLGYVRDGYYQKNNPLSNRLLYSTGLGLDIISYYNRVFQIQFTFNHLKEKGLYLHHKFIF